ncbi:MAG: rhodanese-related sulfurtransferase [Patescibacteria group bacterium]|nr:rhodanese-related sulfurtransferase [Patescibacteria group bacterium]
MVNKHTIILFYKYVHIDDPKGLRDAQFDLCKHLGMKGRMIIAKEGINGTYEGTDEACREYMDIMKADSRFADTHWKISEGTSDGTAFPRLSVKVRKEIVSLHLGEEEDIDPNQITGTHLKPEMLKKWYEEGKEFHVVDMRNDYELRVGKFEGTAFPDLNNFRDLKKNIKKIEDLKDKTVVTVCTGGVRCEKASGLLKREGFKDVYQLDGGIVSYMEKYPGENFKGSLYVFDKRIVMNFDDPNKHEIIGHCTKCGTPSEHYVNCANLMCHDHFICCENCLKTDSIKHPPYGEAYCNTWCVIKWKWYKFNKKVKKRLTA